MLSINVLVVTYNQEKVIGRALDSVLCQKEYGLNKIIICDDCSKDNNRSVLLGYQEKYPEIIENHFNETNLGIYGNCNKLLTLRGDSDLYTFLSGDDAMCPGYFKTLQDFVSEYKIDVASSACCFYMDWLLINPEGEQAVCRNKNILLGSAKSLKLRKLICGRSTIISRKTIDRFNGTDLSSGLSLAEELFDIQAPICSDDNYYIPFVGSIYYSGIGVSAKLTDEYVISGKYKWQSLKKILDLDEKDSFFADYKINYAKFIETPSLGMIIKTNYYYVKGIKYNCERSFWRVITQIAHMLKYYLNKHFSTLSV